MQVVVLNGSPAGDSSITLYTVKYIEALFPDCAFEVLNVASGIRKYERDFSAAAEALSRADLILFSYPVYTFLVPAQLHRFVELMKESGLDFSGKYATQISTSKHFYDMTAHRFLEENCADLGLKVLRGLSADMDDLLTEKGRKEAKDFFAWVLWSMERGFSLPVSPRPAAPQPVLAGLPAEPAQKTSGKKVVVVTDSSTETIDAPLQKMIDRFTAALPCATDVIDLAQFPFKGGCLGCFHCASGGVCVYKDGFDDYLRKNIQSADAIVYAYTVKDHSMGYRFKLYDDRQFCNGHRTVTMGKPVGYLVSGDLPAEENLQTLMEARAQVGGNYLAGIACSCRDPEQEIDQLAAQLTYAIEHDYQQPQNFYGVGGLKIFRDLIYQMRGLMKADHRFYKEHGFYDFPQKKKGRILGMYAVGAMMSSKKLRQKSGSMMTQGMVLPYEKALQQAVEPGKRVSYKDLIRTK